MYKSGPLYGPFNGDVTAPPSPHEGASGNHYDTAQLNKPEDTEVLSTKMYVNELKPSPAALATPHGTAIPDIGKV